MMTDGTVTSVGSAQDSERGPMATSRCRQQPVVRNVGATGVRQSAGWLVTRSVADARTSRCHIWCAG